MPGVDALRREVAAIAHALNNQLNTISGACRVLRLEHDTSGSLGQDLGEIARASARAATLTRSLFALGRGPSDGSLGGSLEVDPGPSTEAPTAPSPTPAEGPIAGATVLLVDDEASTRRVVERMLEAGGYRVVTATSGEDALQIAKSHPDRIDLLLSDVVMPGMSGRALIAALREERPDLRVLFMSGYSEELVDAQGRLDEGVSFLQKPFRMEAMLAKLAELLAAD